MKSAQPIQPQEQPENQETPDFELTSEEAPPAMQSSKAVKKTAKAPKKSPTKTNAPGAAQVLSYRHADRRKNNPEVGLVNEASDPEQPKTRYAYDPHLDPVLQWSGKTERTSFEVDTVSLHVHERIDAMSILSAVSKRQDAAKKRAVPARSTGTTAQNYAKGFQPGLFDAPFENLPLHSAIDFYKHDRGWANRLVAKGCPAFRRNCIKLSESVRGSKAMGRQL